MKINVYQEACLRTWHEDDIESEDRIMHAVLGLNGEAGEVAEIVKKTIFHGHDFDIDAMKKELGDALYYLAVTAHECGLSLEEVAAGNVAKLQRRYPDGWDKERSINRED